LAATPIPQPSIGKIGQKSPPSLVIAQITTSIALTAT
jgi:hypothetical protein